MPELPEVETVVRDLNKKVKGRRIIAAHVDAPSLLRGIASAAFAQALRGAVVLNTRRRGKNILISLRASEHDLVLLVHLKMTGHFLYGNWKRVRGGWVSLDSGARSEKVNQYIRLLFELDNGRQLALSDVRKFAKLALFPADQAAALPELLALGPEPLDDSFTTADLHRRLIRKKKTIKQTLLDQGVVAGIGNIYADDILWESRVHPRRPAAKIDIKETAKIHKAMRALLASSIAVRGASMITYRDTGGERGGYSELRRVYGREGEPCRRCRTAIERIVIAGRSSHFCPRCQPA